MQSNLFGQPAIVWISFLVGVAVLMFVDLVLLNKKDHVIEFSESVKLSLAYITVALLFGLYIFWSMGTGHALDYYTGYIVELSLSVDNLFVISVIFGYFSIPREYQHRVLMYGILGVIIMRGFAIIAGAALIHHYAWVLLIFAAILIITGIKLALSKDDDGEDIGNKPLVKFLTKHMPFTRQISGHAFFVHEKAENSDKLVWHATPLMMALIVIEVTDLLFAFDSVPAVLAITTEPFVVFSSNILAVLGLRAMFFAVDAILHRFIYMKYALSVILVFIGIKVFYAHFFDKIPPYVSLSVTVGVLAAGVILSMIRTGSKKAH
jgi:tellurite resistance protein TerC